MLCLQVHLYVLFPFEPELKLLKGLGFGERVTVYPFSVNYPGLLLLSRIITNSRYALVGYFITSYPTRAHGIIGIYR